jgi:hypothetical protein
MCWNAPVSLGTFLSSIIMCIYIWHRNLHNDRPLSIWIAWFSLMQLFEFFMWQNMQHHVLASKLALITILLQPFVLAAALYYYYYVKTPVQASAPAEHAPAPVHAPAPAEHPPAEADPWQKPLLLLVMLISFIKSVAAGIYALFETKHKWLSVKGPNCHLVWWFMSHENLLPRLARVDIMNLIGLTVAPLLIQPFKHALVYTFIGLMTYVVTRRFYPLEINSLFCWVANILALVTIALPYMKI